jgi:hypothetical protein
MKFDGVKIGCVGSGVVAIQLGWLEAAERVPDIRI